jgi:hypothetical protein
MWTADPDDSVAVAKEVRVKTVALDMTSVHWAFSFGLEYLVASGWDTGRYVQFMDGDCSLHPNRPSLMRRALTLDNHERLLSLWPPA